VNIVEAITANPIWGVGTTVFVTVVGGISIYEYKRRRKSTDQTKEWYAEAVGIIGRLQQAGQQITMFGRNTDEDTLKTKLEPIAADLQSHAGEAPEGVDNQARTELIYLATVTSAVISLSDISEEENVFTVFREAKEEAQQESAENYNLEEIKEQFEPTEFGYPKSEINESDVNEDQLQEFAESFLETQNKNEQITTTDDVFDLPIEKLEGVIDDEDFFEQVMDDMVQKWIEVFLIEVSGEVYEAMEERK